MATQIPTTAMPKEGYIMGDHSTTVTVLVIDDDRNILQLLGHIISRQRRITAFAKSITFRVITHWATRTPQRGHPFTSSGLVSRSLVEQLIAEHGIDVLLTDGDYRCGNESGFCYNVEQLLLDANTQKLAVTLPFAIMSGDMTPARSALGERSMGAFEKPLMPDDLKLLLQAMAAEALVKRQ